MDDVYAVPVTWESCGIVLIKGAASEKAALDYVKNHLDDVNLPRVANYVDDSFHINGDDNEVLDIIKVVTRDYRLGLRRDLYEEEVQLCQE